jgi:hypothetical protein
MTLVLNGTNGLSDVDGSAATPAIRGTDANTGIFFPAADTIAFSEGGTEAMRIDSSGNVGIGTSSPTSRLTIGTGSYSAAASGTTGMYTTATGLEMLSDSYFFGSRTGSTRAIIDSSGNLLVGCTSTFNLSSNTQGSYIVSTGTSVFSASGDAPMYLNRRSTDGALVRFYQDGTEEGSISVSGTTVSYNGGHLSRWAQTTTAKDDSLTKGTVLSNLDSMNVYTDAESNHVANEQLNKVKVSDVEGDVNVAGVFVNWSHDDTHNVDEINMAMTGDMIIRIAQGVTVARGDLLMSAGDGTAKPQGDDIIRSKTVAKVTSTHVTCTYADGSYCVPCVLMAC